MSEQEQLIQDHLDYKNSVFERFTSYLFILFGRIFFPALGAFVGCAAFAVSMLPILEKVLLSCQ